MQIAKYKNVYKKDIEAIFLAMTYQRPLLTNVVIIRCYKLFLRTSIRKAVFSIQEVLVYDQTDAPVQGVVTRSGGTWSLYYAPGSLTLWSDICM